jgi:hypothetical protein
MILCMIFIPKLKFQRDLTRDKDNATVNHTKVSGLTSGAFEIPLGGIPAAVLDGGSEQLEDGRNDRRSSGEKILTSKSPHELINDVKILKYMLVTNQKTVQQQAGKIAELRSLLDANGVPPPMALPR